jgi:lipid-A-disaccharide synthase-like uncharacterized protein
MNLRVLVLAVILVAAAFVLLRALVTRDEVGVIEWIAGIILVLALLTLAASKSRRALRRS